MALVEFTRGLSEEVSEHYLEYKIATKTQAYSSTLCHLRRQKGQGVDVRQQTYVMSCHGVVDARWWRELLAWWGLDSPATVKVMQGWMRACMDLEGNHEIANVRRSLMAGGTWEDKAG